MKKEYSFGNERNQKGWGCGEGWGRGQGRGYEKGGRGDHIPSNQDEQSQNSYSIRGRGRGNYSRQRYDKSQIQYSDCKKYGHYASECKKNANYVNEKANFVEKYNEEELTLLMAHREENCGKESTWYLDTSGSDHMSGNKKIFTELNESIGGFVTFGDGSKVEVKWKGKILIHLKDGRHRFIFDVFYVPNIKSNIFSLGQLIEKKYEILLKDRCCAIRDEENNLIAKVPMSRNRLFLLNIQNDVTKCLKACMNESSWFWHLRYGHVNFDNLNML